MSVDGMMLGRRSTMPFLHKTAILGLNIIGISLIIGMLFGGKAPVPEALNIDRTWRDLCIALWTFVIPSWFTLEALTWGPKNDDPAAKAAFYDSQRTGQLWATFVGTLVAVILGVSSLPANDSAAAFAKKAQGPVQPEAPR